MRSHMTRAVGDVTPLSFTGYTSGGSSTGAISCAPGDLLVAFAFRENTTPASLASGWTAGTTWAGSSCSIRVGSKTAASTSEASGTWTNALGLIVLVFPGGGVGSSTGTNSIGTSISLASIASGSMTNTDGSSWIIGMVGHRAIDTGLETAPSGMTTIATYVNGAVEMAVYAVEDVASFAGTSHTVSGSSTLGWASITLEITELSEV